MTSETYEYEPDPDDFYDDDLIGPPKEEPDCGGCTDSGVEWRRGAYRDCRDCRPSQFRIWRWQVSGRLRLWRLHERIRRFDPTEPPF